MDGAAVGTGWRGRLQLLNLRWVTALALFAWPGSASAAEPRAAVMSPNGAWEFVVYDEPDERVRQPHLERDYMRRRVVVSSIEAGARPIELSETQAVGQIQWLPKSQGLVFSDAGSLYVAAPPRFLPKLLVAARAVPGADGWFGRTCEAFEVAKNGKHLLCAHSDGVGRGPYFYVHMSSPTFAVPLDDERGRYDFAIDAEGLVRLTGVDAPAGATDCAMPTPTGQRRLRLRAAVDERYRANPQAEFVLDHALVAHIWADMEYNGLTVRPFAMTYPIALKFDEITQQVSIGNGFGQAVSPSPADGLPDWQPLLDDNGRCQAAQARAKADRAVPDAAEKAGQDIVRQTWKRVANCYLLNADDPVFTQLTVQALLRGDGLVTQAKLLPPHARNSGLARCAAEQVTRVRLALPNGPAQRLVLRFRVGG